MRKVLMVVGGGLVLLALLVVTFRGPLSLRLMRAGLEQNLGADPFDAFPDGLHVVLCGAGGPLPDPNRSGPCTAIVAGRTLVVVDAGTMGSRNMGPMGVPPGSLDAIFLTHFHSDHIDGLGEMALQRWAGAAHAKPLPVYGPTGVSSVVRGFNDAYQADVRYRVAHHGEATMPPTGAGLEARPFATPADEAPVVVYEADGLTVTAFRVEHEPVDPAVGYRFDYGGRSVLVSGDTKKSAELQRNARGVDLLVHEALDAKLVGVMNEVAMELGRANLAKITFDIPDYHATPVEAAEIAAAADVGHLLYTHIVPPLIVPGMDTIFLEGVSDAYDGPVTLGRDGTRISLPSGSDAIDVISR